MVMPASPLVKKISLEDFKALHPRNSRLKTALAWFFEDMPINTAAIVKHDGLKCAELIGRCVAKGTASAIARKRNVWIDMIHLEDGNLAVACRPRENKDDV